MKIRGDDDAEPGAGLDVDMRKDAALADETELLQAFEERRPDLRALADEDQRLSIGEPRSERVGLLDMVVPDPDLVPGELPEAPKGAERVVIVVEDRDFH